MELTVWTYEGPPHMGALRVAASMQDVHLVLHSPQGDTYADLLFTMIERDNKRPPVTYTTFQARDLGGSTADRFLNSLQSAWEHHKPNVMLVADSCTAELLQDQPGTLAQGVGLPIPVVSVELSAYSRKENWGASETFYQLVRTMMSGVDVPDREAVASRRPRVNLLGPTKLGFRCRDDVREVAALLDALGVDVNVVAPLGAAAADLKRIPEADANICLCPEVANLVCSWLERNYGMKTLRTVPIGIGATLRFIDELCDALNIDAKRAEQLSSRLPWYSQSVDSTYLTGKRVFIFGDATHAAAAAKIAKFELGFDVVGLGTYSRELARDVRAVAKEMGLEALITDNHMEVERAVMELQPELVLGTQMERHIAKRLGIACTVISTPAHVQDFPARYSPQMGFEGANVIFDSWIHPLMMGLEEHLLRMFREDFEFNDAAVPSHLAEENAVSLASGTDRVTKDNVVALPGLAWDPKAEKELRKIPFFVRGKARRNTEAFALERGLTAIDVETLYDAKAHYSR